MGSGSSKNRPPKIIQSFRPERSDTVLSQQAITSSAQNTSVVANVDITTKDVVQITSPISDVTDDTNPEVNDVKNEIDDDSDFIKTVDANSHSSWPIYCLTKFPFNINAHYGGCTSMMLISCAFGGKGEETNAGATLLRSGFDCNHHEERLFYKDNEGHFGVEVRYQEDEYGNLVTKNLFGHNHIRLLTNDSRYGNLRNGIFAEISEGSSEALLHLNVNGGWNGEHGAGVSMILCSSSDGNQTMNAVYMVRSGFKDDHFRAKLVTGDDQFKFHLKDECLAASGPTGSKFALFHNRDNLMSPGQHSFVAQLQSVSGEKPMVIVENVSQHASIIVLCSNSNGSEGCTVSSIYQVAISDGKVKNFTELAGLHGKSYEKSDLWSLFINQGHLEIVGPIGPCKYGVMTNMPATRRELEASINQTFCIATGETTKTVGNVVICNDDVTGEVNKMSDILIQWNEKIHCRILSKDLKKVNGQYKFTYKWLETEKVVGLHLVKIFAVRKHTQTGLEIKLELEGSPRFLIYQKPGVVYALNTGFHGYKAVNDVVYASEFSQYANYDYTFHKGFSYKCFGQLKVTTKLPGSISGTDDGFLYAMNRQSHGDGEDIQYLKYQIENLPNGEYTFRLHTNNKVKDLELNGINVTQKVNINPKLVNYYTGHTCDIDIMINNGKLDFVAYAYDRTFRHTERVCAFALLDKNVYKEKVETEEEKHEETKEKQKIADTVTPPQLTVTRKSLTIVGWCPNLLKNPSGDTGDMKHWNTSSDFKVAPGGHSTENCIETSFNWCIKYQEIDLTEHFTAEYLDTAPDIQVVEWYREGSMGGGFYCMTASLMTDDGEEIQTYTTGEIGSIYADKKWLEASHIFTDYGPGVRKVSFQSQGKDDKFWQGHFGTKMSGAEVRVKRQTESNPDDKYADIDLQKTTEDGKSVIDKIVSNILADNVELLQDFISENYAHLDEKFEKQTEIQASDISSTKPVSRRRVDRKKREIRVFVSSTFRDFQKEREEIIKKAFREINRVCMGRGVFFTYVDLRWGITSEQTSDGKTIAICLQEIDRCRPYFICLMGERFGWSQRSGAVDDLLNTTYDFAIDNNPNLSWIKQYRFDASVTQLEVMHGVLNAKPTEDMSHGFFYMRDPFKEGELPESEYKRMISESEWHHERQEELKSKITNRGDLNIARFKYPDEVADKVKNDLLTVIDKDFPAGTELTKLELQREAHNAFAAVRVRVYIGRQEYFDIINENRSNQIKQPFVLMGESGSGKSALVANWAKRVSDSEPDTFMFLHFIGSSAESASYIKMIRRMYEEIKDYFGLDLPIPTSDQHLINDISKWLRVAGSKTKVVLVFDALNQLDDGAGQDGNEHDLLWIPQELPPNVFILLSTLPGRAKDACVDRGWPSLNVKPLDDSQKAQIITDYLEGIYAKTLTQEQKDMIVNAKQTSNALYLKSLLDEVRMYGSFRTLSAKIQEYLTAGSAGDLFAKILERLEDDFEKGIHSRPHLVRDATTALWCSNRGMSENELVEFLNVPSAVWSPFYLSLFENLVNRDGILNFFHDHLRQAVELKYLKTDEEKKICYLRLADFFETREMNQRKVEELPTLLLKAAEWTRLKATISDLDVFVRMEGDEDGHFELVKAWRHLGDFSQVENAYREKIEQISMDEMMKHSDYYVNLFSLLGNFYQTLGLMEGAKEIYFGLLSHLERYYAESNSTIVYCSYNHSWRYRCKHIDVIKTLKELGSVFYQIGDYDKSIMYYEEAINRVTKLDGEDKQAQKLQLTGSLIGLATVYIEKGEVSTARPMMTRALELAADIVGMTHPFYGAIFTKMGQLAYKQGQIDQALAFYMQNLKMVRSDVGTNHPRIANVLNEIALVYDDTNDKRAGELYEASLAIMLDTYGNNYIGTATIRYNLGAFYFGTNYFGKAKYQFNEAYRIFESFLGDQHPDTIAAKKALETVS